MTALKIDKFGGCLPAWDPRLLPDGQASAAINAYLFSGALIGWRKPKLLYTLKNSTTKFVYRLPNRESNDTTITAPDSFWWEFADADTTVMRTPVLNDIYLRYYFAAPSHPPAYNTYERILEGQPNFLLGVTAPPIPPIVTVDGGGGVLQFGYPDTTPSGGGADLRPANGLFFVPITPTGSMLIQSVSFMPASDDAVIRFQAAVYADAGGAPGQLLGVGEEVAGIVAGTAATSVIINGVSVISNVTYWVGIACDNALYVTVADADLNTGHSADNTYSNGPPLTLSALAGGKPCWQVWADLVGDTVFEARAYVYTWLTEFAEEGPPSPPTVVNGWSNAVWTVTVTPLAPSDPHYTKTRVYRSVTSQTGQGTYFFVAEFPITQTVYVDQSDNATIALNEQLQSLFWSGPPAGLKAIMAMPNGITVGFQSNEIWFSEAYRPHAWPANYVITTEFPIIGLGVCGQSLVVCTAGTPYLVTGVNPATMALTKINLHEPCLHRGSIVATDTTVFYISPNGLIQVSQSGAGSNVTEGWISRERWQALTPSKLVRAIKNATSYFAFGTVSGSDVSVAQFGFTIELSKEDETSFTIWPQPGGHRLGFMPLSSPNGRDIVNVQSDAWTGVGLLVQSTGTEGGGPPIAGGGEGGGGESGGAGSGGGGGSGGSGGPPPGTNGGIEPPIDVP